MLTHQLQKYLESDCKDQENDVRSSFHEKTDHILETKPELKQQKYRSALEPELQPTLSLEETENKNSSNE